MARGKTEDAGGLTPAKSENAVQRLFWPLAGVFPLANQW